MVFPLLEWNASEAYTLSTGKTLAQHLAAYFENAFIYKHLAQKENLH